MVILALDTTTPKGSVALVRHGELVTAVTGDATRTHGERLPGDLIALLDSQSLRLSDVDGFAVCSGPGSFTGLRVGLATIQALALVNNRSVVPVPTLEALAWAALWHTGDAPRRHLVGAWMNAHRGEVFAALYHCPPDLDDRPDHTRWRPLDVALPPTVGRPDAIAEQLHEHSSGADTPMTVIGDAVEATRDILDAVLGPSTQLVTDVPPLAAVAGRIAHTIFEDQGAIIPHAVHPVYVRRPDAELARDRRRLKADASEE